jgi:hypothetical protein
MTAILSLPSASAAPPMPSAEVGDVNAAGRQRFEARAAAALTWALFFGLWCKLLVAVMLTQPVIDAEAESMYNRVSDLALLSVLFTGLFAYADEIMKHTPRVLVIVPLGLASFMTTEVLNEFNFTTAVFEYLKIVTPVLISALLVRLYANTPELVMKLMKVTLAMIWIAIVGALIFLPPSLNRGGEPFWPVYFASLHTASYLVVVCAGLSLYLYEGGHMGRRLLIALVAFSTLLVFHGWEVRTAMVAAVAFCAVYYFQRHRMAPVELFVAFAVLLALAFMPLLFGLVHLPSWDEMVEVTSGRFSMWLEKADILANSNLLEWLFGHGEGSDWIVSEIWWWSAKDSHNDFIRLLNQQGVLGLGAVMALLVVWAQIFPRGVAAPMLAAFLASTAFSNGIMFRPQASVMMPLALIAAADAWHRRQRQA